MQKLQIFHKLNEIIYKEIEIKVIYKYLFI